MRAAMSSSPARYDLPEFEQYKSVVFLTLEETAKVYRLKPKTIRNQLYKGTWKGPQPVSMRPMLFRKVDVVFDVQHRTLERKPRRPRIAKAALR